MIKVLLVGDLESVHICRWQAELRKRGYLVKTVDRIKGPRWFVPIALVILYFRALLELVIFQPKIVHAHYVSSYGVVASFLPFRKVIQSCWGSDILLTPQKNKFVGKLVAFALRRATAVFADARVLLEAAEKLAGKRLNGKLVTWGVDTARLPQASFESSDFVLVSLRNWEPLYNIDLIIKGFELVKLRSTQNMKLRLFGCGSLDRYIRSLVEKSSVKDSIEIVGAVPFEVLANGLKDAHAAITIPSSDGVAASLLEVMGAGLYVIASDLPANREWLDSYRGTFVSEITAAKVADAIDAVVRTPAIDLKNAGLKSREMVFNGADRVGQFNYVDEIYRQILQE